MPQFTAAVRRTLGAGLLFSLAACTDQVVGVPDSITAATSAHSQSGSVNCMTVSVSDSSIVVGDSAQLSMAVSYLKPNGRTATGTVAWTSSNPSVVAIVGQYARGVGTGVALLVATVSSCSSSLSMNVADRPAQTVVDTTTPPPTAPKQLALTVTALNTAVSTPVVSNGIPLPAGWLFERDLASVALSDGTKEVPRVLQALAGRYPDGSLRSVLLQFQADLTKPSLQLLVGGTHSIADPAPWPVPSPLPDAVAFPSVSFLLGSGIAGNTIAVADNAGATYENQFATYSDKHWMTDGVQWDQANYYDRAYNHFVYWMRSGNLTYFQRAVALALNYRTQYLEPNAYNPSPHWMLLEGQALHYWLTGDPQSRTAVVQTAATVTPKFTPQNMGNPTYLYNEGRIQARMLMASLLSWELGDASQDWKAKATAYATNAQTLQQADGRYSWPNWCGYQSNYMVGLQNDALIKYYERASATPSILTTIQKSIDYMRRVSWSSTQQAFGYMDGVCAGTGDQTLTPDLNMLIVAGPAFISSKTGQRSYAAFADSIATGAILSTWLDGSKQFNQQYYDSHLWLGYRR